MRRKLSSSGQREPDRLNAQAVAGLRVVPGKLARFEKASMIQKAASLAENYHAAKAH